MGSLFVRTVPAQDHFFSTRCTRLQIHDTDHAVLHNSKNRDLPYVQEHAKRVQMPKKPCGYTHLEVELYVRISVRSRGNILNAMPCHAKPCHVLHWRCIVVVLGSTHMNTDIHIYSYALYSFKPGVVGGAFGIQAKSIYIA